MIDTATLIQEYSKNPVNNFEMNDSTISYQEWNPICWDGIVVFLKIDKDSNIEKFSFTWDTSMVTTAAVSLLAEEIEWVNIDEVLNWDLDFMKDLWLSVSPRRYRSVVLWLLATRNAIHEYKWDWILDDFEDLWVDS